MSNPPSVFGDEGEPFALRGDECEVCRQSMFVTCSGCDRDMDWHCFDNHECPGEKVNDDGKPHPF